MDRRRAREYLTLIFATSIGFRITTVLTMSLLAGCASASHRSEPPTAASPTDGGSDGVSSLDATPVTYTLQMGSFTFDSAGPILIGMSESEAGRCEAPSGISVESDAGPEDDGVRVGLQFYGDPDGPYDVTGQLEGVSTDGGDGAVPTVGFWQEASIEITSGGERYFATSGTAALTLNAARDAGTLVFSDVVLGTLESDAVFTGVSGQYEAPVYVGCSVLSTTNGTSDDDVDNGCGWLADPAPYTTAFCDDATAEYPESAQL